MSFLNCLQFCIIIKFVTKILTLILTQGILVVMTDIFSCSFFSSQDRSRVSFKVGDACSLPSDLGQFGMVLAANLICRLPRPMDFLNRLKELVVPAGIVVITSPYTWLEEYTPKVSHCDAQT